MKLHPRHELTQRADLDLRRVLTDWLGRHEDLTWAEALRLMHNALTPYFHYPVREERHPNDPEKKADEA